LDEHASSIVAQADLSDRSVGPDRLSFMTSRNRRPDAIVPWAWAPDDAARLSQRRGEQIAAYRTEFSVKLEDHSPQIDL
jgi:hypothetical protein